MELRSAAFREALAAAVGSANFAVVFGVGVDGRTSRALPLAHDLGFKVYGGGIRHAGFFAVSRFVVAVLACRVFRSFKVFGVGVGNALFFGGEDWIIAAVAKFADVNVRSAEANHSPEKQYCNCCVQGHILVHTFGRINLLDKPLLLWFSMMAGWMAR